MTLGVNKEDKIMRYFELLGVQHYIMYLLPAVVFTLVFAIGLGFYHFRSKDAADRETRIIEKFPDGIQDRNAPFPAIAYLTIAGTLAWVLAYILTIGLLEINI
jgi:hypothetical protein